MIAYSCNSSNGKAGAGGLSVTVQCQPVYMYSSVPAWAICTALCQPGLYVQLNTSLGYSVKVFGKKVFPLNTYFVSVCAWAHMSHEVHVELSKQLAFYSVGSPLGLAISVFTPSAVCRAP